MRAFVIAMDDEAEAVRVALRTTGENGERGGNGENGECSHPLSPHLTPSHPSHILLISGIGKVNAAAATQRAIDLGATEIINAGLAGGFPRGEGQRSKVKGQTEEGKIPLSDLSPLTSDLTSNLKPQTSNFSPITVGGVYEVKSAVEYDFDLAKLNGTAIGVLNERTTPFIPMATTGKFPAKILATGDHFNDKEDDYRLITDELGAELRDMEGAAIAHVCEKAGIPCRSLKCVTNVAGLGSMVGQFEENRKRCLVILSEALKTWLAGWQVKS